MTEKMYYCESWFRGKGIPLGLMNDSKAEDFHRLGKTFTALIGSSVSPSCFVESATGKGTFVVGFLDAQLREYMSYSFGRPSEEYLFLSVVTHRDYQEGSDEVAAGSMYLFKQDGSLTIRRVRYKPDESEETCSKFDASKNYVKVPYFGEYEELIKKER